MINNFNQKTKFFGDRASNASLTIACSLFLGAATVNIDSASAQTKYSRFADYCLNFYELPEATQITVRALIGAAWEDTVDTDECYATEERLSNIKGKELQLNAIHPDSITDLTPLTTIDRSITGLRLNVREAKDLTPLASFPNLELLVMEDGIVEDISPLSSLTQLKELSLKDNLISDLSPLSSLSNLEKLNLSGQAVYGKGVRDISPLSSLSNLRELNLSLNNIADVSPLSSLTRLERLNLNDNKITDISSLAPLSSLTYLTLGSNYIPSENRVCPIDVASVCEFGEQDIASGSNTVENEQPARQQTNTQPNHTEKTPDSIPNDDTTNEPTQNDNAVEEMIREAPKEILDGLF